MFLPCSKFYTTYIQCITSELCHARLFQFFFSKREVIEYVIQAVDLMK